MRQVYLDNAATTKMSDDVYKAMIECLGTEYANPSSLHKLGRDARNALEKSRENIANYINVGKNEIIFTSGATESNNMALIGVCRGSKDKCKNHIITTKIEHKSILNTCKYLESIGYDITYLDVDSNGLINVEQVKDAIKESTLLISIMAVNNEIGTIMPIKEISEEAHSKNILFHTDAVSAFGKIYIDMKNIDLMSISGHKIYGPKGIGVLYVKEGIAFESHMYGGPQENGLRPGTESLVNIKAMEVCVKKAIKGLEENNKIAKKRNYLYERISSRIDGVEINGDTQYRIGGNLNISIEGINGIVLADQLSRNGIYVSTSSACNSKEIIPSYVLKALGLNDSKALSAIRITFDDNISYVELDYVVDNIVSIVEELREF